MTLEQLKVALKDLNTIAFELPDGNLVPKHFHVTEVGKVTKDFIDCGGILRKEQKVNLQLWEANDYDHRLHPEKLLQIITLAQTQLNIADLEVEVEYQGQTINKFGLELKGNNFTLTPTVTDCLAKDKCGIEVNTTENKNTNNNACTPGSGCC